MASSGRGTGWWTGVALVGMAMLAGVSRPARADDAADAKQAARDFVVAVAKGDATAAKSHLAPAALDGPEGKFIDALATMLSAQAQFNEACTAKFGPQKKPADASGQMVAQIDQATVNVSGDTASLVRPGDPSPLKLQKIDGAWKVSAVGTAEQLQQATPMLHTLAGVQTETAKEVADGKYPTVAEARAAIGTKMAAAMKAAPPPAPAPAKP